MDVHLVDGTFELFRHHHAPNNTDLERGAVRGVLRSMVWLLERGGPDDTPATHVGVATDHVIESFRNALWPTYKSGEGLPAELTNQFEPLEDALRSLGLVVWPMVELEADDALASAAAQADADERVERVIIATPDKDLGQCVRGTRVIQWDRMRSTVRDADGVFEKTGVPPASIPDWLALVGDSADGFPGLAGFGAKTAAKLLTRFGHIDQIPADPERWGGGIRGAARLGETLAEKRAEALLFRTLATLVDDADLGTTVDDLEWSGPTADFPEVCRSYDSEDLIGRVEVLQAGPRPPAGEVPL
ncbi:5'-3' exonuclease [Euzebya tangerina]|uniref:5'-3' exonuclease n=1 Tax=Euzebya tangerina TaxID=591198 RepID=UPI000E30D06D|nr:5'-3' exonuclease H3TH domain-containing protein [Euzebya tangerina]